MALGKGKRVRKHINYNMKMPANKEENDEDDEDNEDNEEVLDDSTYEPYYIPKNNPSGISYTCFI